MLMIKIVDNFLEKNLFNKLQDFAKQGLQFNPSYNGHGEYYGLRCNINNDEELIDIFKDTTKEKFKIQIDDISEDSSIDIRDLNNFIPHTDPQSKLNLFLMIYGDKAANNGIVFYDEKEIDIHVGFRENRAVLFSSNITHSPNVFKDKTIKRITSTIFIKEYKYI